MLVVFVSQINYFWQVAMKYLYSQPPDLDLCANDIIFSDFDNVSIRLKSSLEVCWQKMQSDLSRGCNDRLDGLESYKVEASSEVSV